MQFLNNLIWFLTGAAFMVFLATVLLNRRRQRLVEERDREQAKRLSGTTPRERSRERISGLIDRQIAESVIEADEDGRRTG
jgi:hypothetical protein